MASRPTWPWRKEDLPDFSSAPTCTATVVLLLLSRAQGFISTARTTPAFTAASCGAARATRGECLASHATTNSHSKFPRHRPRGWTGSAAGDSGSPWRFGRRWRGATSGLKMANPEGTQQLRDRHLEFLFYDEADVRCVAYRLLLVWVYVLR